MIRRRFNSNWSSPSSLPRGKPTEQEGEAIRLIQLATIPLAPTMHAITEATAWHSLAL
jgi:hypothetical protein